MRGIYLGCGSRTSGCLVYLFDVQRFTTSAYRDTYFREKVRPALDRIVGEFSFGGASGYLPTDEQQDADTGGVHTPELDVPRIGGIGAVPPRAAEPARMPPMRPTVDPVADPQHGNVPRGNDPGNWRENHCEHPRCTLDEGHLGPHSFERVTGDGAPAANTRRRRSLAAFNFTEHDTDLAQVVLLSGNKEVRARLWNAGCCLERADKSLHQAIV